MIASFADWPGFIQKAYDNLEPGGYLELHDHSFPLRCDDDTLPSDAPILKWANLLIESTNKIGRSCAVAPNFKDMMEGVGFVDVQEKVYKWPTNSWPRDKRAKELGEWALLASLAGVDAMTLALFTRVLGWGLEETAVFSAQVRRDMRDRGIHAYWAV